MAAITRRNGSYRALVRVRGHKPTSRTFPTKKEAQDWATRTEASIKEGRTFTEPVEAREAKKHTVAEAIERYILDVLPLKPKRVRVQTQQLTWWKKQVGHLYLADLTPAVIAESRDKLGRRKNRSGDRLSASSINSYLSALGPVLRMCTHEWMWLEVNPMDRVRRRSLPQGRVRYLTHEEREDLLRACQASPQPLLYPVVVLAMSTGMRQGEILGLRWGDVDLERGLIVLHETKNKDRRGVPLPGHAVGLLEELRETQGHPGPRELVFPGRVEGKPIGIKTSWGTAVKASGLQDFRFHDLRHTAASYLAMSGATAPEIAAVLGHRTLAMVHRYSHLSQDHLSGVVERMAQAQGLSG